MFTYTEGGTFAPLLAAPLLAALALAPTGCGVKTRGPAVAKHQPAPDFELSDEGGERVGLSQLTAGGGRAVLVFYRGHW